MNKNLCDILWSIHATLPSKGMDPKDRYADICKQSILQLRDAVDYGWLFISYLRRGSADKAKGEPYGVAVAFFIDGVLHAGHSVCMRAPTMPTKKEFATAARVLSVSSEIPVTGAYLRRVYAIRLAEMSPVHDVWRRHIGVWKAIQGARVVAAEDAVALTQAVAEQIARLHDDPSVQQFKMANVYAHVARTTCQEAFERWQVGPDDAHPYVPYRIQGTVVGAIAAACRNRANRDAEVAVVAKLTPAVT